MGIGCSVVGMVDTCLEQDLGTFKASCQDMVDQLEELRRRCAEAAHRAPITRLLFIITRCSRLVFTGPLGPSCCHQSDVSFTSMTRFFQMHACSRRPSCGCSAVGGEQTPALLESEGDLGCACRGGKLRGSPPSLHDAAAGAPAEGHAARY